MAGEDKKSRRHFCCSKKWRTKPYLSTVALAKVERGDRRNFTQKAAAFSSLPRRNAMEPGHLHKKNEEALLACPAIALGDGR